MHSEVTSRSFACHAWVFSYAFAMLLCVLRLDRIVHLCLPANADNFEGAQAIGILH